MGDSVWKVAGILIKYIEDRATKVSVENKTKQEQQQNPNRNIHKTTPGKEKKKKSPPESHSWCFLIKKLSII